MDAEPPEGPHIDIPDPVILKDLATALRQKLFKIIGEAMKNGYFVTLHDGLDFGIAAKIAEKYGFHARRLIE